MPDTPDGLSTEELRELLKKATPGRWRVYAEPIASPEQAKEELSALIDGTDPFIPTLYMVAECYGELAPAVTGCGPRSEANAKLIALTPTLAAEVLTLRAENEALKSKLNKLLDAAVRQAHDDYQQR